MATEVRIWLLGAFRASVGARPVPAEAWQRNRARALVKLLALAPAHRLHREQLMDTLWSDLPPVAAAANLRKALHFARRALGTDHLHLRDDVLSLQAPGLWIDVEAFEAAADRGAIAAALDLYRDDLLIEDRFEPWTVDRREQLRLRFTRLLLESARGLGAADAPAAVAAYTRLVAADPLREEAVSGLMRAHATAGDRHLALREYDRLATRLDDELGVAPAAELSALRDRIAADRYPTAVPAPATAHPAPDDSAPTPVTGDNASREERKLVTVVLLDVVAPPAVSDPERFRAELDACTAIVADVFGAWGGTVERLVGGVVAAVFGVPRIHEDDAGRALRAALELVRRSPLPVRVGVGTGEVIAAAGSDASVRAVTGTVLDVADRLRGSAAPGSVLAATRTCRAAGGGFRLGAPLPVAYAPGGDIVARPVLGLADVDPDMDRPRMPMVGRDAEVRVMLSLFDEVVATGLPRLVTVVGSAGVGKTRIVGEAVAAMIARHPGTTAYRGRCLSAGHGVTYWPLTEILRQACGFSLSDPPEVAWQRCRDGVRVRLSAARGAAVGVPPDESNDTVGATGYALAAMCGLRPPGSPIDRLGPTAVADELGRAWSQFVTGCAAVGPAVLVVEDLHWAGAELVELLELMVARSAGPALLLATARPEFTEVHSGSGAGREDFASISVRPLTTTHSAALLDGLTADRPLHSGLREQVLARAEGNPFFLEELVWHIRSPGAQRPVPGHPEPLPDTLHALLAARIDALAAPEKATLQRAAVLGRTFWADAVARALGDEPVARALRSLEQRGFIKARPASTLAGHAEYAFRHALTHDVAYASVPRVERARAHAEAGEWLEAATAGRREEILELLAYHFHAAATVDVAALAWPDPVVRERMRVRAVECLIRAGTAARRRSTTSTAVELHGHALALADGEDERLAAMEELGDDNDAAYQGDAAAGWYARALDLVRAGTGRPAELSRLCRKAAWMMASTPGAFHTNPDPVEVERFVTEGLAAAMDDVGQAWLHVVHGMSARLWRGSEPFGQGNRSDPVPVRARIRETERALAVGEARGMPDLVEAASSTLGVLYGLAGMYANVLTLTRRDLAGIERLPSRVEQAERLRATAAVVITISGEFEEGLALARRSRATIGDTTNHHQRMHVTWPQLAALYHLGRWRELQPVLDEHLEAFGHEPAISCQFVRDGAVIGATVAAHRGDLDRARSLAGLVGDPMSDLDSASAWQARFALAAGHPGAARSICQDKAREGRMYGPQHALALVETLAALADWPALAAFLPVARANVAGNALLAPACDRASGLMQVASGDPTAAARSLHRALDGFERLKMVFEAARTRERLAAVESGITRLGLLHRALAAYVELDAAPHVQSIRDQLAADRGGAA